MTDKPAPPHVAICVPSLEDHKAATSMAKSALCLHTASQGIPLELLSVQHTGIASSRNYLVDRMLETPATHLFWLDADVVPPPNALLRLLQHGRDIIGATYCQKAPPYLLLGSPDPTDAAQRDGLQRFRIMPSGCLLVHRRVYETLPRPWYFETRAYPGKPIDQLTDLICDNIHTWPSIDIRAELLAHQPIKDWLEKAGEDGNAFHPFTLEGGEDGNFCRKARQYSFDVWCDHSLVPELIHVGASNVQFGAQNR